ncbi:hypothetical protein PanWU01x14_314290 [Parasponia andersonii]|uniref:Transmembrane protein n=1 Tax=Parasponia andersonii TaxID=3476 RepID=A0A2P5ANW1_PARAD|nr:hypothetical protein PanWU01x14_314290 [Parasponia andersonii]
MSLWHLHRCEFYLISLSLSLSLSLTRAHGFSISMLPNFIVITNFYLYFDLVLLLVSCAIMFAGLMFLWHLHQFEFCLITYSLSRGFSISMLPNFIVIANFY